MMAKVYEYVYEKDSVVRDGHALHGKCVCGAVSPSPPSSSPPSPPLRCGSRSLTNDTVASEWADTAAYRDHLSRADPKLPILLDAGVFVPKGTLSESVGAGSTTHLIQTVSAMLVGSDHMREPGEA
jgi:hypothetical protein